ncbi:hypothetical protein [Sphingomonas soli]|nr:hypothetical protein [Sphingomonas soli]
MGRDFDSHNWADAHHHLSDSVATLIQKLSYGFKRLTEIQFDAPWKHSRR